MCYVCVCIFITLLARLCVFHITCNNVLPFHSWFCPFSLYWPHLTISSFHHHWNLPNGRFLFLRYYSTTAWVHLLSMNLLTHLAQQNLYFYYSVIMSSTLFSNYFSLEMITQWYFPTRDLSKALCVITSCCSSFIFIAHVSLTYNITGKMMLLKRLIHRVLLSFRMCESIFYSVYLGAKVKTLFI